MRILLFTQWFDPEPTPKGLVFARELARRGHDVEVVTGFPNYPGGKIYPGYKLQLFKKEVLDGVAVTRLWLYPSHDGSAIKRIANYLSFATSALIYGLLFARKPDVIYAYHPPLTVGVVAAVLRILRRIPVVYDIQDMWPDTLRATNMISNDRTLNLVNSVCNWVYRHVDKIAVLSHGFKELLISRGVPANKLHVIYNWCDEKLVRQSDVELSNSAVKDAEFTVIFAGTMGKAQALDAVLHAAKIVQDRNDAVRFVFIGGGVAVKHLASLADTLQLDNVVFRPAVPMAEIGAVLKQANALLVHLRRDDLFRITIPSKTQAYMAVGKPILMAVEGDASQLVQDANCGICAVPEDAESIAAAILEMASMSAGQRDEMGKRGAAYYHNQLSLHRGCTDFENLFAVAIR